MYYFNKFHIKKRETFKKEKKKNLFNFSYPFHSIVKEQQANFQNCIVLFFHFE